MKKIRRNDPCPCGSGKKYKRCHLGHEGDLIIEKIKAANSEIEKKLIKLPEVYYGRSKEILEELTIRQLAEEKIGIKFIDLNDYLRLIGATQELPGEGFSAGQIINIIKTKKIDPDHIYIAVTPNITDSSLIHQLAHYLCFLKDAIPLPGTHAHAEISEKNGESLWSSLITHKNLVGG
jgi:SEC-C motif.